MADAFDPYYKWLAIPPDEQPANHYRLLGLKVFEADSDVIATAADRQMSHVRSFQGGSQAAASQRLLNELSAARLSLLSGEKKAAYDQCCVPNSLNGKRHLHHPLLRRRVPVVGRRPPSPRYLWPRFPWPRYAPPPPRRQRPSCRGQLPSRCAWPGLSYNNRRSAPRSISPRWHQAVRHGSPNAARRGRLPR